MTHISIIIPRHTLLLLKSTFFQLVICSVRECDGSSLQDKSFFERSIAGLKHEVMWRPLHAIVCFFVDACAHSNTSNSSTSRLCPSPLSARSNEATAIGAGERTLAAVATRAHQPSAVTSSKQLYRGRSLTSSSSVPDAEHSVYPFPQQ